MNRKNKLVIFIGASKLAMKIVQDHGIHDDVVVVSRRSSLSKSIKLCNILTYSNKRLINNYLKKYKNITLINTSASYNPARRVDYGFANGNCSFPMRIVSMIPTKKIKKIINLDTALSRFTGTYARQKHTAKLRLRSYAARFGIAFHNFVIESIYYMDGSSGSLIDYLYNAMLNENEAKLTSGDQERDFISATQVCRAIYSTINSKLEKPKQNSMSICTGTVYRVKDVPLILENVFNRKIKCDFGSRIENCLLHNSVPRANYKLTKYLRSKPLNLVEDLNLRYRMR